MKLNVRIIYNGAEVTVPISCGNGDRTIKWLGLAASQRFALSAPGGRVRCLDGLRGESERAQHIPLNVRLSSGEVVHPSVTLSELLVDGDAVVVELADGCGIDRNGYAESTEWHTSACKVSGFETGRVAPDTDAVEGGGWVDLILGDGPAPTADAEPTESRFMRHVLNDVMVDESRVRREVAAVWPSVRSALSRVPDAEAHEIRGVVERYFCYFQEILLHFSDNGPVDLAAFKTILKDASFLGPAYHDSNVLSVYNKSMSVGPEGQTGLTLPGLVVAVVLCAQLQFGDSLGRAGRVLSPSKALRAFVDQRLLPLTIHLRLKFLVKDMFCSFGFLSKLRELHNDLVPVFEKTALKNGSENSSVVYLEFMADILMEQALIPAVDAGRRIEILNAILEDVRSGYLRCSATSSSSSAPKPRPSLTTAIVDKHKANTLRRGEECDAPENTVIYPEFVEVVARAGAYRVSGDLATAAEGQPLPDKLRAYRAAMEKAVVAVAGLNRKAAESAPTQKGHRRG